ncbi:MAG TPA: Crp/Fnr family transcriptional regulator [Terriglobales bacterium]|nr:Crp/Fnr family transcriptional regulator [Terriglobales bacterium]
MSQSCLDCTQRSDGVFCDLEPDALQQFDGIKSLETWPRGTVLFREGLTARSVFLLCSGRVRLTVCSESGRRMTLRYASAGELLGLSAALSGGLYEVTAEVMEAVQVAQIRRRDLLQFLREHGDICMQIVHLLSEDLHVAYNRVRSVGLVRTRHHDHNHGHQVSAH